MINEPTCVCRWGFGFGLRSAIKLDILKSFVSFLCLFSFLSVIISALRGVEKVLLLLSIKMAFQSAQKVAGRTVTVL